MGRQNVKWEHIFYSAEMFPAGSVAVPKHNCGSRVGMEFLRRQALPVPVGRVGTPSELQVETVSTPLSDDQVAARLSETLSARTVRKLLTILFVLLLHNTLPQASAVSVGKEYIKFMRRSSLQVATFAAEAAALQKLKQSLDIDSASWPESTDPCGNWAGIRCANGHVLSIQLAGLRRSRVGHQLSPVVALDSLQKLPYLVSLNVSRFQLPGGLPGWLGNLTSLQRLDFTSSGLNGSLPQSLGSLFNLKVLWLPQNDLVGRIPSSLGRLSNLTSFNVSGNRLDGQFPGGLDRYMGLQVLDVSGNNLTGPLPKAMGSANQGLRKLVLQNNSFSGTIPSTWGNFSSLDMLDLSLNKLSGEIPSEVGSLMNLTSLILSGNYLNGSIPLTITALEKLVILDLSYNALSGSLPDSIGNLQQLENAQLSNNFFLGYVPIGFASLSKLVTLDISNNFLEGLLPNGLLTNASVEGNCLADASNQLSLELCTKFYSNQGLQFLGFTLLSPADAPEIPSLGIPSPAPQEGPELFSLIEGKLGERRPYWLIPVILGVGGASLLLLLLGGSLLWYLRRTRQGGIAVAQDSNLDDLETGGVVLSPVDLAQARLGEPFTFARLEQATSKFSVANLMLEGHSGDLYKGLLEGVEVVVKRIDITKVKKTLLATELDVMGKISHPRIISLIGHCLDQEDVKLLVYKYMPYGDLAFALHSRSRQSSGTDPPISLDWITRLKVAIGIAEGLTHLHETYPPTVHRDISTTSILLDDKYEVRIGSLSEVRTQDADGHTSMISRLLGLSVDRSADHGDQGLSYASTAQDVYNFGKVLLELVSGQVGISKSTDLRADAWIEWALPLIDVHDKELLPKLVDPTLLVDEDLLEEVWAVAIIAKLCLNIRPLRRPGMRHILKALERPHKVIRETTFRESITMRTSSHSSWNDALFGSWRSAMSSQHFGNLPTSVREDFAGRSIPVPHSRRTSTEIAPEPVKEGAPQLHHRGTTVVV